MCFTYVDEFVVYLVCCGCLFGSLDLLGWYCLLFGLIMADCGGCCCLIGCCEMCVCVWLLLSVFGLILISLFVYMGVVSVVFVLVIGKLPRFV